MDKFRKILISIFNDETFSSIDEKVNEIIKISNSDNIIGCFSAKEIGEAYNLGKAHQKNYKPGDVIWSGDEMESIYARADDLHKSIMWEEPETTTLKNEKRT